MQSPFGSVRRTYAGVSITAALGTTLLSVWAVLLLASQHHGVPSCIAVLAMIVPVAFARRAPLGVAATLAAGSLVNGLFFGHLVRCGTSLPAAFYAGYVVAVRTTGPRKWLGLALVLIDVCLQCVWDPRLGPSVIALMGPATLVFFGAGLMVRSRSELVAKLRDRNAELHEQRERTAELAVAADQARIRDELVRGLRSQIHDISQLALAARAGASPATASLATIETTGRAALDRMREIVGTMHSSPTDPEPGLDALQELLNTATTCGVRLTVEGPTRALPASIELSSYRIVERLLAALSDDPAARAHVRVLFEAEALELSVTGPLAPDRDPATSFNGVLDRAAVHGGTVRLDEPNGLLDAWVRLPLVTSYA